MEDSTPISVALTNLGKYNEGCLAFKWLGLPATTEQVQQAFREIGIDGIRYEEWFLSDYEAARAVSRMLRKCSMIWGYSPC